jgi:hypothetical protein
VAALHARVERAEAAAAALETKLGKHRDDSLGRMRAASDAAGASVLELRGKVDASVGQLERKLEEAVQLSRADLARAEDSARELHAKVRTSHHAARRRPAPATLEHEQRDPSSAIMAAG